MKAAHRLQSSPLKDAASWGAHNATQQATCSAQIEKPKTTPNGTRPNLPTQARTGTRKPTPSLPLCLPERGLSASLIRPSQSRNHQPPPSGPAAHSAAASPPAPGGGGCGPATSPSPPQTGEGGPRGLAAGRVRCKGWRRLTASRLVSPLPLLPFGVSSTPRPLPASPRSIISRRTGTTILYLNPPH